MAERQRCPRDRPPRQRRPRDRPPRQRPRRSPPRSWPAVFARGRDHPNPPPVDIRSSDPVAPPPRRLRRRRHLNPRSPTASSASHPCPHTSSSNPAVRPPGRLGAGTAPHAFGSWPTLLGTRARLPGMSGGSSAVPATPRPRPAGPGAAGAKRCRRRRYDARYRLLLRVAGRRLDRRTCVHQDLPDRHWPCPTPACSASHWPCPTPACSAPHWPCPTPACSAPHWPCPTPACSAPTLVEPGPARTPLLLGLTRCAGLVLVGAGLFRRLLGLGAPGGGRARPRALLGSCGP
jgi:hypothetical protein